MKYKVNGGEYDLSSQQFVAINAGGELLELVVKAAIKYNKKKTLVNGRSLLEAVHSFTAFESAMAELFEQ